jgi:hypothetical protein
MAMIDRQKLAELLEDVDIPTEELDTFIDSLKVQNEIVDPVADDATELHDDEKTYMVVVELPSRDAYDQVIMEMESRGYKVRGNQ